MALEDEVNPVSDQAKEVRRLEGAIADFGANLNVVRSELAAIKLRAVTADFVGCCIRSIINKSLMRLPRMTVPCTTSSDLS